MNLTEWTRSRPLSCCAHRPSDATPRLTISGQPSTKRAAPSWSRRLFVSVSLGSAACAPASAEVCQVVGGGLECDSPEPDASDFVDVLRDSSALNKAAYDKQRLDAYYRRDWRINKLVGREVLPEPCDPRTDSQKCTPNAGLPALPEDRRGGLIEGKGGRVYRLSTDEPVVAVGDTAAAVITTSAE